MTTTLSRAPTPAASTARKPLSRTPPAPLGLELRRPGTDRWAVILPNPAPGQAPFKLQYFTLSRLASHYAYATPQAAYRAARRQGYTEPDPGALERLSQTPA
jgi:hypothetical protein